MLLIFLFFHENGFFKNKKYRSVIVRSYSYSYIQPFQQSRNPYNQIQSRVHFL